MLSRIRLLIGGVGQAVLFGSYTLKLTVDYKDRCYERRTPGIVRDMLDRAIFIWFGIVTLTAGGLAIFMTKFIIR